MNPALLALILTQAQANWAATSYNLGEKYGLGLTVSAITYQESSFCKFRRNKWSVGCMGTKRSTVRRIFDPAATRARLESDNEYSIRAGMSVLLYCRSRTDSWRKMVACYHWGLPHESQMSDAEISADGYVKAISTKVKELSHVRQTED